MKKTVLALLLAITICTSGIAQTSPNSTPRAASPAASEVLTPEQTLATLIAEVKDLRSLRTALTEERDAALARLASEQQISASLQRSYDRAQSEIETLNRSIGH